MTPEWGSALQEISSFFLAVDSNKIDANTYLSMDILTKGMLLRSSYLSNQFLNDTSKKKVQNQMSVTYKDGLWPVTSKTRHHLHQWMIYEFRNLQIVEHLWLIFVQKDYLFS